MFVFHNTVYRTDDVGGVSMGINGTGTPLVNITSRNNIIDAGTAIKSASSELNVTNDFDYDLYQGSIKNIEGQEEHGINASAVYELPAAYGEFSLADAATGVL